MTPGQARKLQRLIRGLSEYKGGWMAQYTRTFWPSDQEPPLAYIRRDGWRHWWKLSETALLAEQGCSRILWDRPAQPIVLWYAKEVAA